MSGGVQHREVAEPEAGMRLDRWVRRHFPALNHGALQKLLRGGQFRVDGKRVEAGTRLATGQTIRVPPIPDAPPPGAERPAKVPRALDPVDAKFIRSLVVHEDEELIALNKPAGLAVQGGTGTSRHVDGMLDALAGRGQERPRLVHRLDRDTSGLMVVARSALAAKGLMHAFQQHRVRKLYWAVLLKSPERDEGVIDIALAKRGPVGAEKMQPQPQAARPAQPRSRRSAGDDEDGDDDARWARTAFRVLLRSGKVAAWTGLLPLTGRTHQIRAHCAAIGSPILGDGKYGGKAAHPDGAPKGLMLHARELEIPRAKGAPLRLVADPPKAFREGLAWVGMGVEADLPYARLRDWPESF